MRTQQSAAALIIALLTVGICGMPRAKAQDTFKVLHPFTWASDVDAGLVRDANGALYGTTARSDSGSGAVYKLTPNPDGTYATTIIHYFNLTDGYGSQTSLIFDQHGNLYGTTSGFAPPYYGTVYELSPNADGTWAESVLYRFTGGADGGEASELIFDGSGNLYGTSQSGGIAGSGQGFVFKLSPNSSGTWTESVLYSFTGGADGGNPSAGLIRDASGNLYGTAEGGGTVGWGVVFKLSQNADGTWKESVLHNFAADGVDGTTPLGALIFDKAGNLYGTTEAGGGSAKHPCAYGTGHGVVFELEPNSDGTWKEDILHAFTGADGSCPVAAVVFDTAGNLYGTTEVGGAGGGVVFKLSPSASGWNNTVLHAFWDYGFNPTSPVIIDPAGNLYGTTQQGNQEPPNPIINGLVYEISQ